MSLLNYSNAINARGNASSAGNRATCKEIKSITNSISRSSDIPGNSAGNTFDHSWTMKMSLSIGTSTRSSTIIAKYAVHPLLINFFNRDMSKIMAKSELLHPR